MGDLNKQKKNIGNLNDPKLPYNYAEREYGTVPPDTSRPHFQWTSEVAYKNKHRIVARGYDTTELMEEGYGLTDMLFVDFQSRIPMIEEEKMLNYIMILSVEDGLSMPATLSRTVARSKTFLTQACATSVLAFGHAYGAYSAFGNMLLDIEKQVEVEGKPLMEVAREAIKTKLDKGETEALGVSELMLKDPAAKRLITRAKKLDVAGKYIDIFEQIVEICRELSDGQVGVDMLGAIGATMLDLGFTPEATWAISSITRSFGAGAHYIEEVEVEGYTRLGEELTAKDLYVGPADRPVPPLSERDQHAKPAQTQTPQEWKKAFKERQKLQASGFAISEEIEDPSKKTGIKKIGK
jgi:citrate synthase